MKALTRLLCLKALVISVALQAEDASPYPVASFGIEQAVINPAYPAWSPRMSYNHDSDITRFRGRYIAAWNANPENPEEGRPGQLNYLSVSDDFQHWSQPVPIFIVAPRGHCRLDLRRRHACGGLLRPRRHCLVREGHMARERPAELLAQRHRAARGQCIIPGGSAGSCERGSPRCLARACICSSHVGGVGWSHAQWRSH